MSADRFIVANRLLHHLLEWGDGSRAILLLHGFLEHGHAWDRVAPPLDPPCLIHPRRSVGRRR